MPSVKLQCGRIITVTPAQFQELRERLISLKEKSRNISREIRINHIGPRDSYSPTAPMSRPNYCPSKYRRDKTRGERLDHITARHDRREKHLSIYA